MSELTAESRTLLALLANADIYWPDEGTQVGPSVFESTLAAIEAAAERRQLAKLRAAVKALPKPPSTPKGRFVWAHLVERATILALLDTESQNG